MHRTEINMTQYFVRRKDAETKIGSWCDWNHIILNGKFVLFTGKYNLAMKLHVPLFNENGECVADVI